MRSVREATIRRAGQCLAKKERSEKKKEKEGKVGETIRANCERKRKKVLDRS